MIKMYKYTEYDDETLKHLHDIELMILNDFIEICEKNNLEYYSYGGTTLGAIRHGGFIPWDDDVDVIMFREEYEKFLEIMKNTQCEKYEILNMENNEDYLFMFSKMSLKGTKFEEIWSKQTSFDVGINIDIFVLDYAPSNSIKWFIYHLKCEILKKFAFVLTVVKNDVYISDFKEKLGHTIRFIFKLLNISSATFRKFYKKFVRKANKNKKMVYDMNAICYSKPFPESIFRPPKKVKFESIEINVPSDVDSYLTILYGDYMKLPPEEERHNHFHELIDFGKY